MDPTEILRAAPELTKAVAALVAGLPIGEIVKRICSPPADLLGEKLKERVERCFEKTAKMTQDAGIEVQAVPPKLLFPILQGAAVEDDETLHTMFAALLANAATRENADKVRPGFVALLREMAPDEAALLNWIHTNSQGWGQHTRGLNWHDAQADLGFTGESGPVGVRQLNLRLATCLDALEAHQLVRRTYWLPSVKGIPQPKTILGDEPVNYRHLMTDRGSAFVEACRPPKPKS